MIPGVSTLYRFEVYPMPQYFWSDGSAIPQSLYTVNFSPAHIAWVLAVLLLIPPVVMLYRRRTPAVQEIILRTLAVVMLLCEVSLIVWQALIGAFTVQYSLPLQLCDISVFIEFAAVFRKRSLLLTEFSYALGMPAALAAMITPGWYFPLLSFGYLRYALMHALLVLIPALLVWGNGYRPDIRRLPKVALLFVLLIAAAVTSNLLLGSNYMFLAYVPPDTTLVVFQTWFGNPGYEIPEFFLLLLIWTALYLPWILAARRHRRK
jgi:hypothetical integral membrane protein (TIGR02206 family)